MTPRWMVQRKATNYELEDLLVIEIYAPGENKELVRVENRRWTYKKELILVES